MKAFLSEFKAFALKGNVMDLAVGVIIGAAFGAVVASLTNDILSPIIGLFTGQNFDRLEWAFLGINVRYGAFITNLLNFVIMAFVVFLLIKLRNKLSGLGEKPQADAAAADEAPPKRQCPYCLTEVHDEATRCPACTSSLA
ncbi:MAG: large conductance mechanosensitive channel protein MscL [Clostridiales bacterium]|nr:large conductance mechanosensitive channel protein MscL [Clostridiales bacterium]